MSDSSWCEVTRSEINEGSDPDSAPVEHPKRIGRYRIQKVLGKGGFGLVYRAYDEELNRPVAVKVPHAQLTSRREDADAYLAEAQTVASLDHPNIVPVHDVGRTKEYPCFVVSKFIEGEDLATKLKTRRLSYFEAAEWVATIAEALHYSHKHGKVHRDVKPGNILIDGEGRPHVVDFGLALSEERQGRGPKYAGTPAYMSPEQARGEGHRVDGRSDVFSLGVVLYECLVGKRPFRGDSHAELREQVTSHEPRPLRQYDDRIPRELERICQKALAKRSSERYSTASDFAEDLRHFVSDARLATGSTSSTSVDSVEGDTVKSTTSASSTSVGTMRSHGASDTLAESLPVRIVPKGLRSFDAHDADFFLELLPGPRDREGLPDSLRFWKTRIEEGDHDETFSVGLIYGPSGCGKSSLVKAGLLPRLSPNVISVYVEATPEDTEKRLLHGLRKKCGLLDDELSLTESIAALRLGRGLPAGNKVLIVIDQFEQWLHATEDQQERELVQALRHCDGGRVQCVVLVRDDFWLAVSRFSRELEVRLLEGHNSVLVDLFDTQHAEKVLAGFGRAFSRLPEEDFSRDERAFVRQSVAELSEGGKVICVRLALFAEMMKSRQWVPSALREVGGTEGVRVSFLEETFSASTASPEHRFHQKAARAVLSALLPESGSDIRGEMKSREELLAVSGYGSRREDFDNLIMLLDGELRLITPTDPGGVEGESSANITSGHKYYQLAHDYLVPSLRDWLTRKQRETRRGRAEIRLAERAGVWKTRPENRHLPSFLEHASIRLLTDRTHWSDPQRSMMNKAGRVYGMRVVLAVVVIALAVFGVLTARNAIVADRLEHQYQASSDGLVRALQNAEISQVPGIVEDLEPYRQWADPELRQAFATASDGSAERLNAALALLPDEPGTVDYLREQLLLASVDQFPVIRDALADHQSQFSNSLWEYVEDDSHSEITRFQAACALATYSPDDDRWQTIAPGVVNHLTGVVPTFYLRQRIEQLEPASAQLVPSLAALLEDSSQDRQQQRAIAATALSDFLKHQPDKLTNLVLVSGDIGAFRPLLEAIRPYREKVRQRLSDEVNRQPPDTGSPGRDEAFVRRSLAAVALVQLGFGEKVWPLLEMKPDPTQRSFLISFLGKLQTDPKLLTEQLQEEKNESIRQALVLAIGNHDHALIPLSEKTRVTNFLLDLVAEDPDSGIHGAAVWALVGLGVDKSKLPGADPNETEQLAAKLLGLEDEINSIRKRMTTALEQLPIRQAERERRLRLEPTALPESLQNELLIRFSLDEMQGNYKGPGQAKWVPGVMGKAASLSGDGSYFQPTDELHLDREQAFSYGCWFRTTNAGPMALIAKMETPENDHRGFDVLLKDGIAQVHLKHSWPDNVIKVASTIACDDGNWYHLFVTYDGSSRASGVRIYLNGEKVDSEIVEDSLSESIDNMLPLSIGSRSWRDHFAGEIDEVRVYGRLIKADEIEQLYLAGIQALATVPVEDRTAEQQQLLTDDYRDRDAPTQRLQLELEAARSALWQARWQDVNRWQLNSQGHTMVLVPSRLRDGTEQFDYSFEIASQEVTLGEFRRFRRNHAVDEVAAPTLDCPVHFVSWYDAAAYCNWLSEKEGLDEEQWCYAPNDDGEYAEGMKIKENYLELRGYRLPTTDEWQHACMGASRGRFCFGESARLLDQYGWHAGNSRGRSHPVASLLPNDLGIFDMHGNLWEWSHDTEEGNEVLDVIDRDKRTLCGGAYSINRGTTSRVITAERPVYRGSNIGLRLARTVP